MRTQHHCDTCRAVLLDGPGGLAAREMNKPEG